jgi:hypothetical protein
MTSPVEKSVDSEPLTLNAVEFLVPGIEQVVNDIRTAFPNLPDESIARILGLPFCKSTSLIPSREKPAV